MPVDEATGGTPPTTPNDDVDIIWSWIGRRTVGTPEAKILTTPAILVNVNICFSLSDLQTLTGNLVFQLEMMKRWFRTWSTTVRMEQ